MNYMRNDPLVYARNVVNQTLGTLYYTGNFDDLELPNANNFKNGNVILHFNKVYVKIHDDWMELDDNRNIIYDLESDYTHYEAKYEIEEEADTALWLALLED